MLEDATCSRLWRKVFLSVVVVVLLFIKCCSSQDEKCGKSLGKRKCGGRHYFLTPQLARAAELPVGSIVCRVHWDETTGVRLLRKTTLKLSTKTGYLLDFMPCWTLLERQVMFLIVREQGAATNVLRMSTKKKSLPRMQKISRKRPNFGSGLCIIFQWTCSRCACKNHRDKIKVPNPVVKEQ